MIRLFVAYLLAGAFFALMLVLAHEIGRLLAESRCLCRKGAIHPDCPRHGWNRGEA
jgi:hypothetical protein